MTTLYTVRCNFNRPDLEAEWNDWYNGPKMANMLGKPSFLRARRFAAHALDVDVKYLAMWELESPAALETPEYRGNWGWGRWRPMIEDWARDLSTPTDPAARVPFAGGEYVHLAWFDADMDAARRTEFEANGIRTSSWWWGSCEGLDNSARTVAVSNVASEADIPSEPVFGGSAQRETIYRPVSALSQKST